MVTGAEQILTGQAQLVLTGSSESMSQAPMYRHALGDAAGRAKMEDMLWESLTDTYYNTPMAVTAENIAERYGVTQEEVDAFSLASQQRWAAAHEAGALQLAGARDRQKRKGEKVIAVDEHPDRRPRSRGSQSSRRCSRKTA